LNRRLAPVVAVMLSVAGCSGSATPTSPTTTSSVVSPAGSWSGSISDAISGDGTIQLALIEQVANAPIGTWSATFKNSDSFSGHAVASLVSNGYGIILYVDQPLPPCLLDSGPPGGSAPVYFVLINAVVTSSRLTAVVGRLPCSGGLVFGTVSLSKQ
jgi:hypothetical protein